MRNEEEQHPDYSFGDLQRLSLLTPNHQDVQTSQGNQEDTPTEQLTIDPQDPHRKSQHLPSMEKQFSSSSSKVKHLGKSKSRQSKSPMGINKKKITDMSQPQSKPVPIKYWQKDEKFVDNGSYSDDVTNGLRRQVADLRSKLSKLTVIYNDLKSSGIKEISRLRGLVDFEKRRRVIVQEDKVEKSTNLMQELVERDRKIV